MYGILGAMSTVTTKDYLDHRLDRLEYRLTLRLGGMLAATVAIVVTPAKLL